MSAKKILALILAVLLGLGALSPLVYMMASAAEGEKENDVQTEIALEAVLQKATFKGQENSVSRIKKNGEADIYMTVNYYNYTGTEGEVIVSQYDGMGSFALRSNEQPTVVKTETHSASKDGKDYNYTTYTIKIPARYSGKGKNLKFHLRIAQKMTLVCTGTVPIAEEYVEEPDKEEEKEKVPDPVIPYIIVESYTYGGDSVIAGGDFNLELTLKNTSEYYSLQNIVMSVATQGVFSMGSSSNTFYIQDLHAGSTLKKTLTINAGLNKVTDDKDANSIGIKFEYQYLHEKERKAGTSSENITIPVTFPDRFELSPPESGGATVFVGEEWGIYIPMINKGKNSINNIMAYIESDDVSNSQRQYIGNLQAGTESGIDFSMSFDSPGTKEGKIVVTYEDTNMNPKELSVPFQVEVQEMMMPDPDEMMPPDGMLDPDMQVDNPKQDKLPKAPIVVTGIIVCGISAYITVLKAKAKRSIFDDEEI